MQKKSIGYFEGTDSALLTRLVCDGHDTLPVSNGYDSHGRHVRLINEEKRYDLLIGYLHKIFAPGSKDPNYTSPQDVFHVCRTYRVPLLLEVPADLHAQARELFDELPDIVQFVDPADMVDVAKKILSAGA
ncbi:MAG: hypothetical protein OEM49_07005 [Myxococcales bacterium]|nr:hypothetical protein [Myxococcales bacterium]MDH5566193.1 hypothetical protein [Myxococcales bacterium]